jgi:hypothetical protein
MTAVSERMYGVICKYCGNCDGKHCMAGVPYYAVSLNCGYFLEHKAEPRTTRQPSMKRIIKRTLVETF